MSLFGMNLLSPLPGHRSSPQSKRSFSALKLAGRSLVLAALWTAAAVQAQNYTFSTLAGVNSTPGSSNGSGSAIGKPLFNSPGGIVVDKLGNTFVADSRNNSIRKITSAGVVTTFAGISGIAGSTDATGNAARFSSPQGSAIDGDGNIYVAEYGNNTIRKIVTSGTNAGVVTTLAGLAGASGSADGTGTAARFNRPISVAVDKSGNVYVADAENNLIRKITSAGVVTTLAGSPSLYYGSTDGTGTAALFHRPHGVAVDGSGNVYVADSSNNTIRKVTSAGVVSTLAGKAEAYGSANGTGTNARFDFPSSIAITAAGDILYVADEANHTIRKVMTATGEVTTVAGVAGTPGFDDDKDATLSAPATVAKFNHPTGLSLSADEKTIYVSDFTNHLVRVLTVATGKVVTFAGVAGIAGSAEGTGFSTSTASLFYGPSASAVDTEQNIYVADTNNQLIRKVSAAGVATTLAGGAGLAGYTDAQGTAARFFNPSGIAVSPSATGPNKGTVYVADTAAHTIRKITAAGVVTTLAGAPGYVGESMTVTTVYSVDTTTATTLVASITRTITTRNPTAVTTTTSTSSTLNGIVSGDPVPATTTVVTGLFNLPSSLVVDKDENVYVADYNNHMIRKITPAGVVTVLAGSASPGSADGVGASASFNHPRGIAIDSASTTLYVADLGNQVIRQIDIASGTVSLFAGTRGVAGSADGAKLSATFNGPSGLVMDSSNTLFVADSSNQTIRAISPTGVVSTPAGSAPKPGYADGTGSAVRFNQPMGICAFGTTLYVADYRNNTIRMGVPTASGPGTPPTTDTGTPTTGNNQISQPAGIAPDAASGGYLFVADTGNNCIKKIAADGTVTVFAGKNQTSGNTDGTGTAALFNGPSGLVNDGANNLYVADRNNALIRKISATGVVTTIAGSSSQGNQDGVGTAATFKSPVGLALDTSGNLYVTDATTHTIRKINLVAIAATTAVAATAGSAATSTVAAVLATPAKPATAAIAVNTVTTVAGLANTVGDTDAAGTAARFNSPHGIAIDSSGNIFVSDKNNNTIRKITSADQLVYASDGFSIASTIPAYTVTTFAGSAGISGSYDGTGGLALFSQPAGLSSNGSTLYIADKGNSLIRSISGGLVQTMAGIAGIAGYRDGVNSTALFNYPEALIGNGGVVVADTGNSSIRVLSGTSVYGISLKDATSSTTTTPTTTTSTATSSSGGGAMGSWFVSAIALLFLVCDRNRRRAA